MKFSDYLFFHMFYDFFRLKKPRLLQSEQPKREKTGLRVIKTTEGVDIQIGGKDTLHLSRDAAYKLIQVILKNLN